jgi:O-palmitoleoyl-L-serine hydrolase
MAPTTVPYGFARTRRGGAAALATALAAAAALPGGARAQFTLTLLPDTAATGARCLDGSPAGYYYRPGDPSKWVFSMQGGGWCWNLADCETRAGTTLGSSKDWPKAGKFGGILDVSAADNPDFYNYSMVLAPYCDGASFSGHVGAPVPAPGGTQLYFRGHDILVNILASVLPLGLSSASELLVMGGSAGGLATMLHADFIGDTVRAANPGVSVSAVPDCGFFLGGAPDVFGRPFALGEYQTVAAMQNVTGSPDQVDAGCWTATPPPLRWQCFLAPYTYAHISTRTFLSNSQYDTWQLANIWAPPGDGVDGSYAKCIKSPLTACNSSQYDSLQAWHVMFQTTLNMSAAAAPGAFTQNGGFVSSCLEHGQQEEGLWDGEEEEKRRGKGRMRAAGGGAKGEASGRPRGVWVGGDAPTAFLLMLHSAC